MTLDEYRRLYGERDDASPGWDAIDARLAQVYGYQKPRHWGSAPKYILGGPDPLDGISFYECRDGGIPHLHVCTYGYSSLYYDEESASTQCSLFGFEMTFRLASPLPPPQDPYWVINLLNNLARYVFNSGRWFEPYHLIPAGGPICIGYPTDLVGLAFLPDPVLGAIDTPHGPVQFLQAFGLTADEMKRIGSDGAICEQVVNEHRARNPLLVTDLDRGRGGRRA